MTLWVMVGAKLSYLALLCIKMFQSVFATLSLVLRLLSVAKLNGPCRSMSESSMLSHSRYGVSRLDAATDSEYCDGWIMW
jgi:hypothetical protein